jgi:flagellar biosynthesis GTPase FlhF
MSSITINTKDFSDPNFNAKTWINSVLRPPTIQTERISTDDEEGEGGTAKNTTILVTKLQMASESASRQFDQLSTTVMKSMPRVLYDLKLIADDAKAAHEGVEAVKKNLGLIEGDTEAALEKLRKPHIAKTRMEECRMLLLEKSDHLNKLREEKERKQKIEQEAAAAAAAAEEARVQAAKEESEKQQLLAQQQEEEEQRLRQEEEAARREMEAKQMEPVLEEKKVIDEALEYGHVQLPPLRQPPPKQRTLQQIQNAAISAKEEDDSNSYLQQISESMTPQVSNVFKRIGVPVSIKQVAYAMSLIFFF